jgi:hypothetical protein
VTDVCAPVSFVLLLFVVWNNDSSFLNVVASGIAFRHRGVSAPVILSQGTAFRRVAVRMPFRLSPFELRNGGRATTCVNGLALHGNEGSLAATLYDCSAASPSSLAPLFSAVGMQRLPSLEWALAALTAHSSSSLCTPQLQPVMPVGR